MKQFLAERKRQAVRRKRELYVDRGVGTVQDTYVFDEIKRLAAFFTTTGNRKGLRDRLDFLLGHALMAQGKSTRLIQHFIKMYIYNTY